MEKATKKWERIYFLYTVEAKNSATDLSLKSSGVTLSSALRVFAKFINSSAASLIFTAVGRADTR